MTVRISQGLITVLQESEGRGWFHYKELEEKLPGVNALHTLLEGYSLGLFNIQGEETFEIREEGLKLLEAWREAGEPRVDPWIDSRVHTMLETVHASGSIKDTWLPILEERGLAGRQGLSRAGEKLLELLGGLERRIILTKAMARELAKAPDGPVQRDSYGRFLHTLEAMGLLVGTVPSNQYYTLTAAGRLLKKAMIRANLDAPWTSVVNERIIAILEKAEKGEKLEPGEVTYAGTLGYLKPTGALDYPGRLVLRAYRSLRERRRLAPMALSSVEEKLIKAVVELWREASEKPNIETTRERIEEKYLELWGNTEGLDLGLDLLHLESLGLVEESRVGPRRVYKPTGVGEDLASLPGIGRGTPVRALKSITSPLAYTSPSVDWVVEGLDNGVLGRGGPTRRGEILARASGAARRPLVTRIEALLVQRLPEEKSIPVEELLEEAKRLTGDPWKPVNRLEARGMLETLPDDTVRLTSAGRLLKTVLLGVPPGIAVPISPPLVKVLRAVEGLGSEDLTRLVNEAGLTLETVRDMLVLARSAKLLGRKGGLTEAGRALLELARLLEARDTGVE